MHFDLVVGLVILLCMIVLCILAVYEKKKKKSKRLYEYSIEEMKALIGKLAYARYENRRDKNYPGDATTDWLISETLIQYLIYKQMERDGIDYLSSGGGIGRH